jgi:hypothetical protein
LDRLFPTYTYIFQHRIYTESNQDQLPSFDFYSSIPIASNPNTESLSAAGLPSRYRDSVRAIRPGLPLFLYNYSTHQLHGIFEVQINTYSFIIIITHHIDQMIHMYSSFQHL